MELKEVPSGWVKGSLHKKADWHWWGGGMPREDGVLECLCGYELNLMGVPGEKVGEIERQDFPPSHYVKPTCRECKKALQKLSEIKPEATQVPENAG